MERQEAEPHVMGEVRARGLAGITTITTVTKPGHLPMARLDPASGVNVFALPVTY